MSNSTDNNQEYSEITALETQEWLESLDYVLKHSGPDRVKELLKQLQTHAYEAGVRMPFTAGTPYINTIPADEQPPYPGAVIVTAQKGGPGSANDVAFTALPSLVLHTTDDVATVLAFYVEALPGWTKYDYFGMDYLYKGSGEFKPFEKSGLETPNVFVMELPDAMKYHAMPDAVTSITISYK